jgi:sulfur-carrier protein
MLRVKLFAVARELADCAEVTVALSSGASVADLRQAVEAELPALKHILPHALWAVDAAYAGDETVLDERSEIALIPPVSGG